VQAIAGRRDPFGPYEAEWTPPARAWLDPNTDVKAEILAQRGGLMSPQEAIARRGEDFDDVIDQYVEATKRYDEAGLVFDSDPRKTSAAGLTQARPEGTENSPVGAPAD